MATKKKDRSDLGLTVTKSGNFSEWYQQVVFKAEFCESTDISGCYIFKPWSFAIWEEIQRFFDGEIKKLGVKNAYFPMLITESALMAEKDHVEGFAPEVAWVTRAGQSQLDVPLAIRPTSETCMYSAYSRWIRSHRDLPLRLNQWVNILRWEFKHPVPFLRTREFLWQEGHSAFATKPEADKEVRQILELYRQVYEDLLAVPVTPGQKSEKEKFAGALYTTTCEAYIAASGRGIQGATSHCLGQNFARMFNIRFQDAEGKNDALAWQNSWGLTTRTIGVMLMVHGDDRGAVLPPRIAPTQLVLIPIIKKDDDTRSLLESLAALSTRLAAAGLRVHTDDRDGYNPGFKYNHWEVRGVPLRLEYGARDAAAGTCVLASRIALPKFTSALVDGNQDNKDSNKDGKKVIGGCGVVHGKENVKVTCRVEDAPAVAQELLDAVQRAMLAKAKEDMHAGRAVIEKWEEFVPALQAGKVCLAPWCDEVACEDEMKGRSQKEAEALVKQEGQAEDAFKLTSAAKTLCKPFEQPPLKEDAKCFCCGKKATTWVLVGRSY